MAWIRIVSRVAAALAAVALGAAIAAARRGHAFPVGAAVALGVVLALALALELALALRALAAPGSKAPVVGRALLAAGLLFVVAFGLWNWARTLKALVVLVEGEEVSLDATARLPGFEAGPLVDRGELAVTLRLAKVQLRPGPAGGYFPEAALVVTDRSGERLETVAPGKPAIVSALAIGQGAFGFAPRLVVQHDGAVVLDEVVPFDSVLDVRQAVAFRRTLTIARESLEIEAELDLTDLDANMKGHPSLSLTVKKEGRPLGEGRLKPGHFSELSEGYRIGFAGLSRWIELDVRRRSYGGPMLAGAAVALAGLVLWALGALLAHRRRG